MAVPEKNLSRDLIDDASLRGAIGEIERNMTVVVRAVADLSDAELRFRREPGKWCALEIIAHLADVELVYSARLRQMVAQPGSTITPLDQEAWGAKLGYLEMDAAEVLERYRVNRQANLRLLRRLSAADLRKSAYHPEFDDDFTIADLVAFLRSHDPNHLRQLESLKQAAAAAGGRS